MSKETKNPDEPDLKKLAELGATPEPVPMELVPSEYGVKMHLVSPTPDEISEHNMRFAVWSEWNYRRLNNGNAPYYLNQMVQSCLGYVHSGINRKIFYVNEMNKKLTEYYGKSFIY